MACLALTPLLKRGGFTPFQLPFGHEPGPVEGEPLDITNDGLAIADFMAERLQTQTAADTAWVEGEAESRVNRTQNLRIRSRTLWANGMRVKRWRADMPRSGVSKLSPGTCFQSSAAIKTPGGWQGPASVSCQERGRSQELAGVSNGTAWIGVLGRLRRLSHLKHFNPSFKRVGVGGSDGHGMCENGKRHRGGGSLPSALNGAESDGHQQGTLSCVPSTKAASDAGGEHWRRTSLPQRRASRGSGSVCASRGHTRSPCGEKYGVPHATDHEGHRGRDPACASILHSRPKRGADSQFPRSTGRGGHREDCSRGRGKFQSLVDVQVEPRLLVFSVFSGRAKAKACAHIDSRSMSSLLRHRHLEELVANNKRPASVSCQARGRSQERLREKTQTTPSARNCRGVRSPSTLGAQRCGRYGGLLSRLLKETNWCATVVLVHVPWG